jgi:hypothetical protein
MFSTGPRWVFAAFMLILVFPPAPAAGKANPHYGPIVCTSCHVDEEDYELKSEDHNELCNSCHGETSPPVSSHHPLRMVTNAVAIPEDWPVSGDSLTCLTCHLPSHDENIGKYMFLRDYDEARPQDFCGRCHRLWEMRDPHAEANEQKGCDLCHHGSPKPGEDTLKSVRFYAYPTVLCLRCHDVIPHPGGYDHTAAIDSNTAKLLSAKFPLLQDERISCSTCHNPHVVDSSFKVRQMTQTPLACPGCHSF